MGAGGGLAPACPSQGCAALGWERSHLPCCRQKILKEKAVPMIEGYMFEEHELIRLAATECMCNMAMSREVRAWSGVCWVPGLLHPTHSPPSPLQVQELFLAENSDRLKLMVLYSGEEDEKLRRAASGTLAMLTALHPPICKRIPQVVSAPRWGGGTRDTGAAPVTQVPSPGSRDSLSCPQPDRARAGCLGAAEGSAEGSCCPADSALAGDPAGPAAEHQHGAAAPRGRGGDEHGGG